ncbi:hypothetical protein [Streptomyces xinghaiensis]|uniref:hypothetical protein n=1 Tax=Streptomyces xinghaiensis TaxID=1038928 RepID=UPI0002D994BD|nr:hypothetical protein [Streptomyces xinghaiensis]MZE75529.1 hypothetical protein [Streptomyces sp. SID5475]
MRRISGSVCASVLFIGVAVTTAGCSAATDDPAGSGQPHDTAGPGVPERELTDAEHILVQRAEQILTKECMKKAGFSYWIGPLPTVDDLKGGRYVLTDVEWARKYGYGGQLEKKSEKARLNDPNAAYANALPEAERIRYSRTLDGDPSKGVLSVELPAGGTVQTPREGCWAETRERLYGDPATWFRVKKTATSLTPLYVPDLVKDKRLVNAVEAWSRCMREAGHAYAGPDEIREKRYALIKGLSPGQAHATEVELAVAEATCAVETSLGETARSLEREYRSKKLRRYSEEIATYQRMRLAALARAKDVIGSEA